MLTTAPHLYIRRPSPTTAEFTVTTRPPLTLPLRLALISLSTLRITLFFTILFTLYTRFFTPLDLLPTTETNPLLLTLTSYLQTLHLSPAGQTLTRLVAPIPAWLLAGISIPLLCFTVAWELHTSESLLVLRGLGIQTSTAGGFPWGSWRPATRFIPTEKIRDVLINEAFRGFEVRYYLVVVVEGEEDVVVVFPRLLPRRKIVEAVWRGVRGCLYEANDGMWYGVGKG
ncbi:putative GPI-GlcNAc transferase complex [Podospora aff. communis PSN243]|uniref:GPI-GlcNAc transferase complex n=1 Tax=Podospora aff. communis PSN243 TaxID=3040156 RepID=A0AAV9H775_9PEZI|nr:putative GPI-GlcNAc transferase complex [Podospora aff. communis PSN243]